MGISSNASGKVPSNSTIDPQSNSLNDYAHLTRHLQSKSDPVSAISGQSTSANDLPEEERLSEDISLLMDNMRKLDVDRKK